MNKIKKEIKPLNKLAKTKKSLVIQEVDGENK